VNKTIVKPRVAAEAGRKTILKPRLAAAAGHRYVYVGFSRRKISRSSAYTVIWHKCKKNCSL